MAEETSGGGFKEIYPACICILNPAVVHFQRPTDDWRETYRRGQGRPTGKGKADLQVRVGQTYRCLCSAILCLCARCLFVSVQGTVCLCAGRLLGSVVEAICLCAGWSFASVQGDRFASVQGKCLSPCFLHQAATVERFLMTDCNIPAELHNFTKQVIILRYGFFQKVSFSSKHFENCHFWCGRVGAFSVP